MDVHDKTWLPISRGKNRVTSERDEDAGKKAHQKFLFVSVLFFRLIFLVECCFVEGWRCDDCHTMLGRNARRQGTQANLFKVVSENRRGDT